MNIFTKHILCWLIAILEHIVSLLSAIRRYLLIHKVSVFLEFQLTLYFVGHQQLKEIARPKKHPPPPKNKSLPTWRKRPHIRRKKCPPPLIEKRPTNRKKK